MIYKALLCDEPLFDAPLLSVRAAPGEPMTQACEQLARDLASSSSPSPFPSTA